MPIPEPDSISPDPAFRRWYRDVYLRSDQWQEMRLKVLRRANGFCEGCGAARATQVHHLTYDHVGAEFLWELVAICEPCHERVHGVTV